MQQSLMRQVLTPAQISGHVDRLAEEISKTAPDISACIVLMDGAMIFAADLLRALYTRGIDPRTFSLRLSSYGKARETSGRVRVTADIDADISAEHVLIIDDVLDSGATLDFARAHVLGLGAAKVSACVFARKPYARRIVMADYAGWDAPDAFLIGYGLDDGHKARGLPGICVVE